MYSISELMRGLSIFENNEYNEIDVSEKRSDAHCESGRLFSSHVYFALCVTLEIV